MKKVYQLGNTLIIEDSLTGEKKLISMKFFSFELYQTDVQLVDSSKAEEVISINQSNFLDETGIPVGALDDISLYLSQLNQPVGTVQIETSSVQLVDENDIPLAIQNGTSNSVTKGIILMGEDNDGNLRRIRTEDDGRLISSASVTNPPNSIPISQSSIDVVANELFIDYIIPNGVTIVVQEFNAGAEADSDGSKVELVLYSDNTHSVVEEFYSVLFVNGSNGSDSINKAITGDGVKTLSIRKKRLAGAGKEIFGKWQGYYFP
jgi:hypothetical protein